MHLVENDLTPIQSAGEAIQQAFYAQDNATSVHSLPLELLILSWDQFVNELEFE